MRSERLTFLIVLFGICLREAVGQQYHGGGHMGYNHYDPYPPTNHGLGGAPDVMHGLGGHISGQMTDPLSGYMDGVQGWGGGPASPPHVFGGGGFGAPFDITATEEQMAETLSETPAGSQERQRLESVIKRNGGRLTGQASSLNYLVQEYLLTTPIPMLPPTNNHFRQWRLANQPPPDPQPTPEAEGGNTPPPPGGVRGRAGRQPGIAGRPSGRQAAGQEVEPAEGGGAANGHRKPNPGRQRLGENGRRGGGRGGNGGNGGARRPPVQRKKPSTGGQLQIGGQSPKEGQSPVPDSPKMTQWQQKFSGRSTPQHNQQKQTVPPPQYPLQGPINQGVQNQAAPILVDPPQAAPSQPVVDPTQKAKLIKRRPNEQQGISILGERLQMIQNRIDKLVAAQKGITDSNQNFGLQQQINKLVAFRDTLQGKRG